MDASANVIYTALEILIAIASSLGNILVIWAIRMNGPHRQPTFYFVMSLGVADFMVGAVAIPLAVLVDGVVQTSFRVCLFISCALLVLTQSSVLSLLAIAVDRYLRVRIPFRYRSTVTVQRSWAAVAACWLLSGVLGFTPMLGWYNTQTLSAAANSTDIVCRFVDVIPMTYLVYLFFLGGSLLPLLAMMILYANVFCIIQRHLRDSTARGVESRAYFEKECSLAKSLALVLILFVVCWLPLHFMNCVAYFFPSTVVPTGAFYVGILLSHANSAVNPVVYAFRIRKIRAAYLRVWRRYVICQEEEAGQNSQTADNTPNSVVKVDRLMKDII